MSIRKTLAERESSPRRAILGSLAGHLFLFLLIGFSSYFWAPQMLLLGGGVGGGSRADLISVGLVEELSGGAGTYKPTIVPQPQVAPPAPRERRVEEAREKPDETVFVEKASKRPKTPEPVKTNPRPKEIAGETNPSAIPQEPRPGSGGAPSASLGSGSGQGSGIGIQIGTGRGGPGIDSWYVRQLEQRVGQNWLRTSLQGLDRRVRTEISFDVATNGSIENVEIQESSGLASVDQAARRAVLASNPLPPVPVELRGRDLRVVAVFEYPPR